MYSFSEVKNAIIEFNVNAYLNESKDKQKDVLKLLIKNNDFRQLYLLYEEFENKYFDNKEVATYYVNELANKLSGYIDKVKPILVEFSKKIDIPIYEGFSKDLDVLLEHDSISTINKKIDAKINLINFLLKEKYVQTKTIKPINEDLLTTTYWFTFNSTYNQLLSEEEKVLFKEYSKLKTEDVITRFDDVKTKLLEDLANLKTSDDVVIKNRVDEVIIEINDMEPNKYNLYKIETLKQNVIS